MFLGLVSVPSAHGWTLEEAWDKYAPVAQNSKRVSAPAEIVFPGRLLGQANPARTTLFQNNWGQRTNTYELHYEEPTQLSRTVYGLALHARDVDNTLPQEKFINKVLGYHYSIDQVCAWANALLNNEHKTNLDDNILLGMLLMDKVLVLNQGRFEPGGTVKHILAAAPGKKRSFADNLRHERLHVLWDEDPIFKQAMLKLWEELPEQKKTEAKAGLNKFAKDNERQLIEEWAIKQAEKQETLR